MNEQGPYQSRPEAPSDEQVAAWKPARPLWVWSAISTWVMVLAILLEYTLASLAELEPQAAILAGAIFIGLLMAGIITLLVRTAVADPLNSNTVRHYHSDGVSHEPNQ